MDRRAHWLPSQADEEHHDVNFESADAGASLTYPQQAGTIRKNAFIVIKNRPCKVRFASPPAAEQSRPLARRAISWRSRH